MQPPIRQIGSKLLQENATLKVYRALQAQEANHKPYKLTAIRDEGPPCRPGAITAPVDRTVQVCQFLLKFLSMGLHVTPSMPGAEFRFAA